MLLGVAIVCVVGPVARYRSCPGALSGVSRVAVAAGLTDVSAWSGLDGKDAFTIDLVRSVGVSAAAAGLFSAFAVDAIHAATVAGSVCSL